MSIIKQKITNWFKDEGSRGEYREGLRFLERSGIFEILRRIGTPTVINYGQSADIMAGQAHFSAGYQLALDQLQYFEQVFEDQQMSKPMDPPDFCGMEEAIRLGHIRPGDIKKDKVQ